MQDVGDRHRAAAVVEETRSGAEDVRLLVARGKGEREAGREVVVVMEVVLPVVPEAEADGEARPHLPVVLDVGADLLLEECEIAIPLLLGERIRPSGRVGVEAREIERAAEVAAVVETATAPV